MTRTLAPKLSGVTTRKVFTRLLPAAFLLAACSRHAPPPDEQALLQQLGFDRPVALSVQLNQSTNNSGNLSPTPDGHLIALLTAARLLSEVPYTAASPWWHFAAQSDQVQGGSLVINAGSRAITDRTDQTYWSEGSDEYYAETIHYNISILASLASVPGVRKAFQGSLRLVLRKDPAISRWEVFSDPQRGTRWMQDDGALIRASLADTGASFFAMLVDDIQASRRVAFDEIARNLDDQGILAQDDKGKDVLVSRRQQLMYYVKPNGFSSLTPRSAAGYCAQVHTSVGENWRLPVPSELSTMIAGNAFIDTPDHRLWGAIAQPATVDVAVVMGSLTGIAKDSSGIWRSGDYSIASPQNIDALPDVIDNLMWPTIEISPGLTMANGRVMSTSQRQAGDAVLTPHDSNTGAPAILRIICVTTLPKEVRPALAPQVAAKLCPNAVDNAEATSFLPQNAVLTSSQPEPAPKPDHYLCTATGPDRSGAQVTFSLVAKLKCTDMSSAKCVQVTRITTSRGQVLWNALE